MTESYDFQCPSMFKNKGRKGGLVGYPEKVEGDHKMV